MIKTGSPMIRGEDHMIKREGQERISHDKEEEVICKKLIDSTTLRAITLVTKFHPKFKRNLLKLGL